MTIADRDYAAPRLQANQRCMDEEAISKHLGAALLDVQLVKWRFIVNDLRKSLLTLEGMGAESLN